MKTKHSHLKSIIVAFILALGIGSFSQAAIVKADEDYFVGQVNYMKGYSIRVYNLNDGSLTPTDTMLADGTTWKVYGSQDINGNQYYKVGGNQWVEAKYVGEKKQASTSANIAEWALAYQGVPYVYGGNTEAGFDCSGFAQYVFAQNGISLPRTSQAQSSLGYTVKVEDAQPGDLYFWGGVGSAYHVAIALGNGKYVHAPQPGQNVRVQDIWQFRPSFARHVLN